MMSEKKISLFWWNEVELMGKSKENYGDLVGKYLVEKISNRKAKWVHPKRRSIKNIFRKKIYVTVGSVLAQVTSKCIVWGSGIISKDYKIENATFLAVRGPRTRAFLMESGYKIPEVYGDPALLLPNFYNPEIKPKFRLGIIPHYNDYKQVMTLYANQKDILIIDLMTNDVEFTTNQFLQCEKTISSSLHGLIVSHAYGIPSVWTPFSNSLFGDGVKYQDYFESVSIKPYAPEIFNNKLSINEIQDLFHRYPNLPDKSKIEDLKKGLMQVCPFKSN